MAGSTILGLGSGLDIEGLVTALVTAETAPKAGQIKRLEETTDITLSAMGTLKGALDTFQTSLDSLEKVASNFSALSASSSKDGVASVSVGDGAVAGSYTLEVQQLATASKVATQVVEGGAAASFASGSLNIALGSASYTVNVAEGASLADIRNSINDSLSASAGISANIVTDASGSRLVISSETTGEGTDLSVTGSNPSLAQLNIEAGVQQSGSGAGYITLAQDAQFTLDGLAMTSATNTVSNAVSGLTLTLEGTEEKTTIKVAPNTEGLKTSVETFVTSYNTLITMTNALTKPDPSGAASGALVGDASVRTLLNSLRNALVAPGDDSGGLSVLSQLGITTQKDGTLAIDDAKLDKALDQHYASVGSFFTGSDGLLSRLDKVVDSYTRTGGVLDTREKRLQSDLVDLAEQKEALTRRSETLEARLYKQFNSMDILLGQLESTRNSITSMFDAMTAQQKNS